MVLPTTGPISISAINTEFSRGNNLDAYRGVIWFKPASNVVGNFSSGQISMQEFYGTNYAIIVNVSGLVYDFNLRATVDVLGYNGSSPVVVICNLNGSIYGSSIYSPAFTTGPFLNNGCQVILNIAPGSLIVGRGGDAGQGWAWYPPGKPNGDQGGTAIELGVPTRIMNQGIIASGGGGGGGSSTAASSQTYDDPGGSGGGGAGSIPGQPGNVGPNGTYYGQAGTLTTGGDGGYPSPHGGSSEWSAGRNGGRGGDWGQPGQNGSGDYGFGIGGAAGYSLQNLYWLMAGSSLGAIVGRTDFVVWTEGDPNAQVDNWSSTPPFYITTSILVRHNSGIAGPYTWNYATEYGGVGILSEEYINEHTRRLYFQSATGDYTANYYSVFTVTVYGMAGLATATRFGVTHTYTYNDPSPPPVGSCFLPESLVLMADGTYRMIKDVLVGDQLVGGFGYINTVLAIDPTLLGNRPIYWINGEHNTTNEHRHWTTDGWASIDPVATMDEHMQTIKVIVDPEGNWGERVIRKFTQTPIHALQEGMTFITLEGAEPIQSIVADHTYSPDTTVYSLQMSGSHTFTVNRKIVSGWATDEDFDYTTWTPRSTK